MTHNPDLSLRCIMSRAEWEFSKTYDIDNLRAEHMTAWNDRAALAKEVKRLQAIVDELPRTADGVPVIPRSCALNEECSIVWVFTRQKGLYRPGCIAQWWKMTVDSITDQGKFRGYVDGSHYAVFSPDQCYSTREAGESSHNQEKTANP